MPPATTPARVDMDFARIRGAYRVFSGAVPDNRHSSTRWLGNSPAFRVANPLAGGLGGPERSWEPEGKGLDVNAADGVRSRLHPGRPAGLFKPPLRSRDGRGPP